MWLSCGVGVWGRGAGDWGRAAAVLLRPAPPGAPPYRRCRACPRPGAPHLHEPGSAGPSPAQWHHFTRRGGGMKLDIVIFGLAITSSWGNGHAVTYRALIKALRTRGHSVTFLERDTPWYREHRDLENPDYCRVELYKELKEVPARFDEIVGN